jgi:hypothetical protein
MNSEDMANFIESLNPKQVAQFQQAFKTIGDTMEVEVKEETQQEETVSSKPQSRVSEDFKVKPTDNSTRKVPVRAKDNKWKDTGEKRDPNFDPAVYEAMGKSERDRPKAKKVELDCHVCGRTFMESPKLVYGDYHRCNRCGGR